MKKGFLSSLRTQVWLMIVSTILIVVALGGVFLGMSSRMMEEKTAMFVHTLLSQSAEAIENTADEMRFMADAMVSNDVVQSYLLASDSLKKLELGDTLSSFAGSLLRYSDAISHIVIVNPQGHIISATQHNVSAIDYLDQARQLFDASNHFSGFVGPVYNTYDQTSYLAYAQPVYNTQAGAKLRSKIGTCVVFTRMSIFQDCLRQAGITDSSVQMLVDGDGQILTSIHGSEAFGAALLRESAQLRQSGAVKAGIAGTSCIVDQLEIGSMGYRLISAIPCSEIALDLTELIRLGMIICLLFVLLSVFWGVHVHHSLTKPLIQLTQFIDSGLDTSLSRRIAVTGSSEISHLCGQINVLLDKVEDMTQELLQSQTRMYELNLAKSRAELSALQSQINPHFLYNTLDCIKGYGYLLQSEEIVEIANSLSAIMRYSIKGASIVSLRREMEIVSCYLHIIAIRFKGRFDFIYDVDPEMMEASVPRFILQPVVENAVYHGLEPKLSHGTLKISAARDGEGDLLLTVRDDGVGIREETLKQLSAQLNETDWQNTLSPPEAMGLALLNIHQRVRGLYGPVYGVSVFSVAGKETRVVIRMPFIREA